MMFRFGFTTQRQTAITLGLVSGALTVLLTAPALLASLLAV